MSDSITFYYADGKEFRIILHGGLSFELHKLAGAIRDGKVKRVRVEGVQELTEKTNYVVNQPCLSR